MIGDQIEMCIWLWMGSLHSFKCRKPDAPTRFMVLFGPARYRDRIEK
jgi:hypothetical protein